MLSIAAGVTIASLEALAPGRPVVRAMPNTPALVGLGVSAIAPGRYATESHLELASRLLGAVGIVVTVREPALRGHRALGVGPGLRLPRGRGDDRGGGARRPAATSRSGSSRRRCSARPRCWREATKVRARCARPSPRRAVRPRPVCAKLESARVRAALLDAVSAATRRSRELGE